MKQYKLEILDMINFCQNNIYDTNILKQNLNNYFTARIKNKKTIYRRRIERCTNFDRVYKKIIS